MSTPSTFLPLAVTSRLSAALEAEQERWFLWTPVLLGLGIAAYFHLAAEPGLLAALVPVPAALALARVWRTGSSAAIATGIATALALGFAVAKLRTEWVRAPVLERHLNAVQVRGFVELVEPRAEGGRRVTVRVAELGTLQPAQRPLRVRVRTKTTAPVLHPGDAIVFKATLGPPAIPSLPGDYDFARAAYFQRLGGVGYMLTRPQIDPQAEPPPSSLVWSAAIGRVRQAIGARIVAALPGERGAIANALITGERGGISAATNDAFRDSGLLHILSISGLHMTIMAGAVFLAVRFALAAIPAVALTVSTKKWAAATAALAAFAYLLVSGAPLATVRSYIMISIMFLAVLLDRPALALRNVALAALAILLVYPESLFDVGFQMSFAAVVALVAAYEEIRERAIQRRGGVPFGPVWQVALFFGGIVLSTLVASVAVAPFAAYHFHKSQQFALLANLIAIPICNVLVMPAALLTLVLMPLGIEALPLRPMGWGIDVMVWCAYTVAALPGAVGRIPAIPTLSFAFMVAGGLWLTLWRSRRRFLGLALAAIGVGLAPTLTLPDVLVGRDGHLMAVRTPERLLSAATGADTAFELQRWLEHDGDGRSVQQAVGGEGLRCDAVGCVAEVKGLLVALARHPAALADDCRRARVLILPFPRPAGCASPGLVIDFFALRANGTHALYIDGSRIVVRTVADVRGDRPWSQRPPWTKPAPRRSGEPASAARPAAPPRPDIEEEDEPRGEQE
ncbi:MAG: ComEC/Rec2 family competence protein [Hyphomicrobiaceae bacterium]